MKISIPSRHLAFQIWQLTSISALVFYINLLVRLLPLGYLSSDCNEVNAMYGDVVAFLGQVNIAFITKYTIPMCPALSVLLFVVRRWLYPDVIT
jgi:hypothetical protein